MKKSLLLTLTIITLAISSVMAQPCLPDPDFVSQGVGVYPFPYNQAALDTGNTDYVGIEDTVFTGQDYSFTFTAVVPDSLNFSGTQTALEWVLVDSIGNMPEGLSYECDLADCEFQPAVDGVPDSGLGCVAVTGVSNAPAGSYSIIVYAQAKVGLLDFPIPVTFPPDEANAFGFPEGEYLIHVVDGGTNVEDLNSRISSLNSYPNPFASETAISFVAESSGDAQLEIFDISGQKVHSEKLMMRAGENEFIFNGSMLAEGTYIYGLTGQDISLVNKFTVSR